MSESKTKRDEDKEYKNTRNVIRDKLGNQYLCRRRRVGPPTSGKRSPPGLCTMNKRPRISDPIDDDHTPEDSRYME